MTELRDYQIEAVEKLETAINLVARGVFMARPPTAPSPAAIRCGRLGYWR